MRKRDRRKVTAVLVTAGLLAASAGLTGCADYASSQELRQEAEQGDGSGRGGDQAADAVGQTGDGQAAAGQQGAAASEIAGVRPSRTMAPMPEFQEVSDQVYVISAEGGSVRIRSSCDTADSSNIVTYALPGTKLTRTGISDTWTRIDYNGMAAYISADYVTDKAPEAASASQTGSGASQTTASGQISLDPSWKYAEYSKIHTGAAVKYRSEASERKEKTICINAGHGTKGGSSVKTQCHPDGTPKVTGGTTGAGAVNAVAVSGGMTFLDGTPESKVTLAMALVLKDKLLSEGYDVLMIREGDDVQLDNIARTVIANNASDCHIALHWDSTESNKGAFYMSVPSASSYRAMEPVASHWQQHNALGEALISGLRDKGVKIFSGGAMEMDLTQTSYSTVPSIDIELGDKASDHSQATLSNLADGLAAGISLYFQGA